MVEMSVTVSKEVVSTTAVVACERGNVKTTDVEKAEIEAASEVLAICAALTVDPIVVPTS